MTSLPLPAEVVVTVTAVAVLSAFTLYTSDLSCRRTTAFCGITITPFCWKGSTTVPCTPENRWPSGLGNVALAPSEPVAASTTPVRLVMRPLCLYSVPFFITNVTSGNAAMCFSFSSPFMPACTCASIMASETENSASIVVLPLRMVR